ncbi:antibiotic biosynthesis monooxygenase family protein [Dyella tabacisoli]|uniref:Antibiotic biosynthesis monooxygenase n=1 Tax=Dyella tabacisoli TaxID=2282381 RepID=A0A369US64_9GAMM|nr:antibiotic biosynthesis monooxygenase family protein [Dyella tabacisoli]RDD83361.1 antibiotic biosynthesis monooxygenase [Dyella tabacisoli]
MIVEYIRYKLPAGAGATFESDYARAAQSLAASPYCHGYELSRCSEEPDVYVLRIRWSSAEDHMQGFRRSPEFGPFLAAIRSYVPQIEEMRHYELTAVVGGKTD